MTTAKMTPGAHASSSEKAISSRTILLSPIDAWFFRDGRPYNSGESNQTDVASLFPPPATTVVGALRAGLAREKGWDGVSNWSTQRKLADVLGDGFEGKKALGAMRFRGPWLVRRQDGGAYESLFPMPLHVLGKPGPKQSRDDGSCDHDKPYGSNEPIWQPQCLLTPADEKNATSCDLGDVRLPMTSSVRAHPFEKDGLKEPSSQWVTQPGLKLILSGQLPTQEHVVEARDLWKHEIRVGLKRNEEKRVTEQGGLYSPRFVRLARDVSLAMTVNDLPEDWHIPKLLALGGEGRMADCSPIAGWALCASPAKDHRRFTVTLLTPLMLPIDPDGTVRQPVIGQELPGLTGSRIVSACVGKSHSIGGWDSTKRQPLPLRPVLPAGSTWFCECDAKDWPSLSQKHGQHIGDKRPFGYGQIVLGNWPQ
ncbi:MAG: type III-B CRISPR module-associated Cmr3 family protein [Planctomycetia bacterium]|nr:type III-B CRISPR module-associated Cmr3 family protein [Planctomycetia bacterium]